MATPTWTEAAVAKSRAELPRLQARLDAARADLDKRREQLAAVERAIATLDRDGDPDLIIVVEVAAQVLPPLVAEAEAAVAAAMAERRGARLNLLPSPEHESPWSRIVAARQADSRRSEELSAARLRLGELQRGRAAALGVVREAGPGTSMVALAAAEAEVRLSERVLPAAREALAVAEAAAQQARTEAETLEARARTLRVTVLTGEPQQAEVALAELLSLVGEERSGLMLR